MRDIIKHSNPKEIKDFSVPENISWKDIYTLMDQAEKNHNDYIIWLLWGEDIEIIRNNEKFIEFYWENIKYLSRDSKQILSNQQAIEQYSQLKNRTDITSRDLLNILWAHIIDNSQIWKDIREHEHKLANQEAENEYNKIKDKKNLTSRELQDIIAAYTADDSEFWHIIQEHEEYLYQQENEQRKKRLNSKKSIYIK